MGYIKEPAGVDFIVDSAPLTTEDRKMISEIIAYYKATGRKMLLQKPVRQKNYVTSTHKSSRIAVREPSVKYPVPAPKKRKK